MIELTPKVSVIVPVYNAANFVEETILSVINQTYRNWELILIDDGSKDNSIDIINKYRDDKKVFLLQHPKGINLGVSKTRELGVEFAKGDYIAFLDADDVFYENKLENQLRLFKENSDVILVHSMVELLNDTDISFKNDFKYFNQDTVYKYEEQQDWLKSNKICNSTVTVKTHIIKGLSFGLPQLFQYEDWLLWSLLSKEGKFYYQQTPLIKYRVHLESATSYTLKNKLVSPYSKIEYLLSLYFLSNSDNLNHRIIGQLKETIISLFEIYSNKNITKINKFRHDVYDSTTENVELVKRYNELLKEYHVLESKYSKLNAAKNTKIYILLNKINKFFKGI